MATDRSTAGRGRRKRPTTAGGAQRALLSTADRIRGFYADFYEPYGLTSQQYNVLRILRGAPEGLPTLSIGKRMIERVPGITRLVDRLEAKGLVRRRPHPSDRRYVYCQITERGLALLEQLDEPVAEANRAAFRALDEEELEQLVSLLDKVATAHRP